MASGMTTTTQVDPAVSTFYDRVLLRRALPYLVHGLFGQKRPLPANSGTILKFRRYSALDKATVALTEGVNPTASQMAKTDVTATPLTYGQYVEITDEIDMTVEDKVLTEAQALLGESAGLTLDTIYRDILNAGTAYYRAGGESARSDIVTKVTTTDLDKVLRTMRNNKAKYFTRSIKASTGVGSLPIRASYYALAHPDMIYDLEGLTGFVPVASYGNPAEAHENEVGAYKNLRIIESTECKIFEDSGGSAVTGGLKYTTANTACDVYTLLCFGMDAYGVVDLKGHAMQSIIKPFGAGDDALNRVATAGWKAKTTCVILNDAFMCRYEAGVTA